MKRGLIFFAVALVFGFALSPFASAQVNLVQNPGFETYSSTASYFPSPGAWVLGGDTGFVEIGKLNGGLPPAGMFVIPVYEQDYAAQLGNTNEGTLTQTVAVDAGQLYQFSFALRGGLGGGTNSFKAEIGGETAFSGIDFDTGDEWSVKTYSFTPTTGTVSADIVFTSSNERDFFYLDAVSLVPVPEPGTILGLAGLGLMGGGAFWWRKRQNRLQREKREQRRKAAASA